MRVPVTKQRLSKGRGSPARNAVGGGQSEKGGNRAAGNDSAASELIHNLQQQVSAGNAWDMHISFEFVPMMDCVYFLLLFLFFVGLVCIFGFLRKRAVFLATCPVASPAMDRVP